MDNEQARVRTELLVEELLELERPPALFRVKRGFRVEALKLRDDARRVADPAAVEHEHGQRVTAAQPPRGPVMEASVQRVPRVADALVVERPAHLLVVVRDLEVP